MFTLKKAKKYIGEFETDDTHEWTLLYKPQVQDVTEFVHLQRLWLVQEQPKIEPDHTNGIVGQEEIRRIPICMAFIGFVKNDKFIVQKTNVIVKERDEVPAQIKFLRNLQNYYDNGFTKDLNNYNSKGEPIIPSYYSSDSKSAIDISKSLFQNSQALTSQVVSSNPTGRTLNTIKLPQSQQVPTPTSNSKTTRAFLSFLKKKENP